MDCSPLNLAHFHERRADKFLKHHRYDDASKAIETSLLYVQNAYKNALIAKSIEVLNTQKWDYERKLRQIKMRKLQYERLKLKEIVPIAAEATNSTLLKPDCSVTAMSISKSIDKTIEDFDNKFNNLQLGTHQQRFNCSGKENKETKPVLQSEKLLKVKILSREPEFVPTNPSQQCEPVSTSHVQEPEEEFPSLAPLELPSFDFITFPTSAHSLGNISNFVEF